MKKLIIYTLEKMSKNINVGVKYYNTLHIKLWSFVFFSSHKKTVYISVVYE